MDIKELEDLLELQKAYASVQIGFGKGSKFSKEVKDKVSAQVKEFCLKLASNQDMETGSNSPFTPQEVEILKLLAQQVTNKTGAPTAPAKNNLQSVADVARQAQGDAKPMAATLLTTDNIPGDRRKHVDSNDVVHIIKLNDKEAAIINPKNKQRFVVPVEDLELVQE